MFGHRTIAEFLTARYLAWCVKEAGWEKATLPWVDGQERLITDLIDHKAWLPGWHEVITFLGGLLARPRPMIELLTDETKDDDFRHRLALALLRTLAEVRQRELMGLGRMVEDITRAHFDLYWSHRKNGTLNVQRRCLPPCLLSRYSTGDCPATPPGSPGWRTCSRTATRTYGGRRPRRWASWGRRRRPRPSSTAWPACSGTVIGMPAPRRGRRWAVGGGDRGHYRPPGRPVPRRRPACPLRSTKGVGPSGGRRRPKPSSTAWPTCSRTATGIPAPQRSRRWASWGRRRRTRNHPRPPGWPAPRRRPAGAVGGGGGVGLSGGGGGDRNHPRPPGRPAPGRRPAYPLRGARALGRLGAAAATAAILYRVADLLRDGDWSVRQAAAERWAVWGRRRRLRPSSTAWPARSRTATGRCGRRRRRRWAVWRRRRPRPSSTAWRACSVRRPAGAGGGRGVGPSGGGGGDRGHPRPPGGPAPRHRGARAGGSWPRRWANWGGGGDRGHPRPPGRPAPGRRPAYPLRGARGGGPVEDGGDDQGVPRPPGRPAPGRRPAYPLRRRPRRWAVWGRRRRPRPSSTAGGPAPRHRGARAGGGRGGGRTRGGGGDRGHPRPPGRPAPGRRPAYPLRGARGGGPVEDGGDDRGHPRPPGRPGPATAIGGCGGGGGRWAVWGRRRRPRPSSTAWRACSETPRSTCGGRRPRRWANWGGGGD